MWGASLRLHTKTVQAAAYGETMQAKAMPSIWEKKLRLQQILSFYKVVGKYTFRGEQYCLPVSNLSSGEHCTRW